MCQRDNTGIKIFLILAANPGVDSDTDMFPLCQEWSFNSQPEIRPEQHWMSP